MLALAVIPGRILLRSAGAAPALPGAAEADLASGVGSAEEPALAGADLVPWRVSSGTPAAGVYPLVEVAIDGKKAGQVQLSCGAWRSYFLDLDLVAGAHELRLSFVNDFGANGEDRNLMLDKVGFYRE